MRPLLPLALVGAISVGAADATAIAAASPSASAIAGASVGSSASVIPGAGPSSEPTKRLHNLFDREWTRRLADDPVLATMSGLREGIDRLATVSLAEEGKRAEASRRFLRELATIPRDRLSVEDQVSYDVFRWELEHHVAGFEHHEYRLGLSADSGFHTDLARLPEQVPLSSVADYEAYFARLRAIPTYVEGQIELLEDAIASGWTLPRAILNGYDHAIASHVVENPEESVFFAPLERLPGSIPAAEKARLVAEGKAAVRDGAVVGYRRFLDFFRARYLPAARETLSAGELPGGGRELYQQRIRYYTTLDMTPQQVHDLGLREVERIRTDMESAREQLRFAGDLPALFHFMRTDPQFFPATPEALLERAAWIAKQAEGELPRLFGRLPRTPFTVKPVPAYLAPKYTAGRYVQPPADGSRAGIYWVNTFDLPARPLYNLEALTLHEAVPGHHLQIALSLEADAPAFRRDLYISAFGEGWGLYAEWLGIEAGFYQDPYSNLGRLTYEMWRACRLVVDTGIHAFGWTRDQAIAFLRDNTALSLREVESEIDRYISWPGQALAYKIGELEIRRLRGMAQRTLGAKFDVRAFHDEILRHGSIPLPILAGRIEGWIKEQERQSP